MERELKNLDFKAWVHYCFDHPVSKKNAWYFKSNREWWNEDANPALTLSYLTRLFGNAPNILASYSDEQVNQGLWFIGSNACSSHMFVLTKDQLPESDRVRCVEAMNTLYQHVFAKRCAAHLSHLDTLEAGGNPVNLVCYMWWDNLPLFGQPNNSNQADVDKAALSVMEKALSLKSIACQESALHGLGHWHYAYQPQVEAIIDNFLDTHKNLKPELSAYARAARQGGVL